MKSSRTAIPVLFLSLFITVLTTSALRAQNEVALQKAALKGINSFYVTVNVEGVSQILKYDTLNVSKMQREVESGLAEAGLPLDQETSGERGQDNPLLHVHVNVMDAGQGLIPFSVDVEFYQPVKLVLQNDIQSSASTWSSGSLGLVSYDRLGVIRQAMLDELDNFIREFRAANE